ncbi:hypothetical protein [Paenibacillus sp. FSL M8-0142]|uniref:hypothetical protein n=1 Tax=Paenibacillus sp. FSL M8-0142 TaxID=2954525 RepID=UPI00315ACBD3
MDINNDGKSVYFHPKNETKLAFTDYEEKLWEKIQSTSWHVKTNKNKDKEKKYINSSKLGLLHRVVMSHWYGEEALAQADKMKYVVDHMDNDGFNCYLENLCFIPKEKNTAKGLTYDKKRAEAINTLAINIFKDFETQLFQITIGFNAPTGYEVNGQIVVITAMKLTYQNDFERTLANAEKILHDYITYGSFDDKKLDYIDIEVIPAIPINISPDEMNAPFIERDGEVFLNLDSEHVRLDKVAPNKELYQKSNKK